MTVSLKSPLTSLYIVLLFYSLRAHCDSGTMLPAHWLPFLSFSPLCWPRVCLFFLPSFPPSLFFFVFLHVADFLFTPYVAGGGIGGGAIYVPIFTLLLGLPLRVAVPVSQATIFGGSISNLVAYVLTSHPLDKSRNIVGEYQYYA